MNTIGRMKDFADKARRIAANLAAPNAPQDELERLRLRWELKTAAAKTKVLTALSAPEHSAKRNSLAAERKAAEAAIAALDASVLAAMTLARIRRTVAAGNDDLSPATIRQRAAAQAEMLRTGAALNKAQKVLGFDGTVLDPIEE